MAFFQPESTIFFACSGLDDQNKTVHSSMNEFVSWLRTKQIGEDMTGCSFQRVDQGWEIRVSTEDIAYELLLMCDSVCINNALTYGGYWYTGIIDRVEWKNPGCSYVYFHIDWYSTTLGNVNYEGTWAYIEREHVKDDWAGSNPNFSNMGVDEGFATTPDTPIRAYNHQFSFLNHQVMVYTPYDNSGQPNFEGKMEKGIYTAMYRNIMTTDECNQYLKQIADSETADLAMIPSIVSIPIEFTGAGNFKYVHPMPWLDHIPSVPNLNNAKCWSGEFCQMKLCAGTGASVSVNPQWFGSDKSTYTVDCNVFFNGGDGGCTAAYVNENTTYDPTVYGDFSVTLSGLPQAVWVGDAYAQWKSANMNGYFISQVAQGTQNTLNTVEAITKAAGSGANMHTTFGAVNEIMNLFDQAGNIMRTIGNARVSGTVLGGSNNADVNTACALDKYGFQMITYMCQAYIMNAVDDFFDRYGYKVNRLKQLDRKTRPRWTYIKCHEVHLSKGGYINHNARMYIQSILCNGVTFWADPDRIGDYSNPEENKG